MYHNIIAAPHSPFLDILKKCTTKLTWTPGDGHNAASTRLHRVFKLTNEVDVNNITHAIMSEYIVRKIASANILAFIILVFIFWRQRGTV